VIDSIGAFLPGESLPNTGYASKGFGEHDKLSASMSEWLRKKPAWQSKKYAGTH
jgi:hypothetical protein